MKILMATMSLGIGGAETHIVELSKELARRGHDVTIVSDGGDYVDTLKNTGVRHVKLPLDSKRPDNVAAAYRGIKRMLRAGNFDVVHSHSRISSFICGRACARLGVRFVTTCHGVYDMNEAWRRMANWGTYQLAVSYDTKDYLIREYGVPADNIGITINGIDTAKFSPMPPDNPPAGLSPDAQRRVIYVSRIDDASAHVAFMLAEIAPELEKKYPGTETVIIGGGDAYDRLKDAADKANSEIGRRAVITTGAVTNVGDYLRFGGRDSTVFVGVSRAALEAMACGLPAVISGSQGYIGIFSADTEKASLDTNLCGRGMTMPDKARIMADIDSLFSRSPEERKSLGAYGRAFVREHFTVTRMADDAEALYNKVRPFRRPYKDEADIMLAGYYGFGNTGDDSLLYQITESLKSLKPDLETVVLAHSPKKTEKYSAVRAINRFDLPKISRQMKRTKLLINGGGSLLQNSTSMRSLYYYSHIIEMAKKSGMKTMLYGSGIGPLTGETAQRMAARALSGIDAITLRDEGSMRLLTELGVDTNSAAVTADPAFLLEPCESGWLDYLLAKQDITADKTFTVSLRGEVPGKHDADICDRVIDAARLIADRTGLTPVFVPLQQKQDYEISRQAAEKIGGHLLYGLSPRELRAFAGRTRLVLSMRLHILIYAFSGGTPTIGLDCDPKVSALIAQTGSGITEPVTGFIAEKCADDAVGLINSGDGIGADMLRRAEVLKRRAASDALLAMEILSKTGR